MTLGLVSEKKAYPIIKWVGGKRQLINQLIENIPKCFNSYFEPFFGGGALFFELQPKNAYISDINPELINLYCVIRDNPNQLIVELSKHQVSEEYFLMLRNLDRSEEYSRLNDIQKASRFIYLNKTCFNGLYRVNSKGQFNVPFGKYKNPKIFDEDNLLKCSNLLKEIKIKNESFEKILGSVKKGDFVYFDPPYAPLNKTSNFTSYTKEGFGMEMQVKLKELCDELNEKKVFFMLSNSDTKIINDLYKEYNIKKILASRMVNSKAHLRGKISEVLVKNY